MKHLWTAVSVALLVILGVVLLRTAWVCDDAFITFRTVDNLVAGHGAVWNVGARVQTYTHPLWMLMLVAGRLVSGECYLTSIILGIVLTLAAGIVLVWGVAPDRRSGAMGLAVLLCSNAVVRQCPPFRSSKRPRITRFSA